MTDPDEEPEEPEHKTIIVDASNGGTVAIGEGARATHVEAGATYIENQTVIQEAQVVSNPDPQRLSLPFLKNDRFVGREDLLAELHALLSQDPPRPLGLAGLGGIGKTQLAVEYAYRHKTYYPDGIFWFNAAGSARRTARLAGLWSGRRHAGQPAWWRHRHCIITPMTTSMSGAPFCT